MTSARAIAVLGTSSHAGKSWLATALCRWYAREGIDVAPFKAQNMSNNARVVALGDGASGEIGSAQYLQALAAGVTPEVRMNPVLLKPEADTRSQVVVNGLVRPDLADVPWRERSALLWPFARRALADLQARHELVVIEGAGSPAEINLAASDFVNTRSVIAADAATLLVADIDRGGAFAHLHGTHALMDAGVRERLRGFVLNKFRGDPALLAPAPAQLQALTGVPTLAVLPMLRDHGLPEEDGVAAEEAVAGPPPGGRVKTIAIVAAPHLSNLDEFQPLRALPGVRVTWARNAAAVAGADLLILPGSKHTRADLAWMRERGFAAAITAHAQAGRPLLAICGGLQITGRHLDDPLGVEGGRPGSTEGLGLLPLHTRFEPAKQVRPFHQALGPLHGPWQALSGLALRGYEIRAGRSTLLDGADDVAIALPDGLGWQRGPVLALAVHGLFENPAVTLALWGAAPTALEAVFDRLADTVDDAFGRKALLDLTRR
jgi:adenosylcobyric acid synthase